ncbi:hypothetical protein FRB99_003044 [Tulasnella sp. 403]|nr:hypothetical protein FRB99_003044 [Tulasnella sp. 403]
MDAVGVCFLFAAIFVRQTPAGAKVLRIIRPPSLQASQPHIVTLQGVQRIQLSKSITLSNPAPLSIHSTVAPSTLPAATPQTIAAFRSATIKLLSRLASEDQSNSGDKRRDLANLVLTLSGASRAGDSMWGRMIKMVRDSDDDHMPAIADLIVALIGGDFDDRAEYIRFAAGEPRITKATHIVTKKLSLIEVTSSLTKSIEETVTKQQKEFILRQQLTAIQRELARLHAPPSSSPTISTSTPNGQPKSDDELDDQVNDEAELADVKRKIEALLKGSEERKAAVREYRRLKRIPPGSVETSVVRNYLDWLVSLPWPTQADMNALGSEVVMNRSFLERARAQLDADHYGLEKVKKRLIEYLAVVRLKQMAAAKEAAELAQKEKVQKEATATPRKAITNGETGEEGIVEKMSQGSPSGGANKSVPVSTPAVGGKTRIVNKGPILLLYGPPGVGKTSVAQSLARALNRPFQRISLGGVRDEAEIRGHRRTYVGSGPGNIVQALRKAGRLDPVILLIAKRIDRDEIDKVAHSNFHGDPAAALLEVLDPEQNWSFMDHYLNVPIDLSQVLFIATANTLDTISGPLLDRCEVLRLPGYTRTEKLQIAKTYLIPKQLKANGMDAERCVIEEPTLKKIISGWTREAGVRTLERRVGGVVRAKAVEWSEGQDDASSAANAMRKPYSPLVKEDHLELILGPELFDGEERDKIARRGVVYGLVVMGEGEGGILPVETAILPGSGQLRLSGSLGEVIRESAELSLSWVKSHAYTLGITPTQSTDPLKHPDPIDIHLHLPAGAQKKDGPSAGIAMICAFVSLLSGLKVPPSIAMTGEITLRGAVTPVGGVKEKVLGAHRAGVRKVILPKRNKRDVFGVGVGGDGVPEEVRREMEFVFVERVEEALAAAFADEEGEKRDMRNFVALEGEENGTTGIEVPAQRKRAKRQANTSVEDDGAETSVVTSEPPPPRTRRSARIATTTKVVVSQAAASSSTSLFDGESDLTEEESEEVKQSAKKRKTRAKKVKSTVVEEDEVVVAEKSPRKRRTKVIEPVVYDIPDVERKETTFKGRLGYACLNTILRNLKPDPIFCSRTCRISTIKEKGMKFVYELGLQNVRDLAKMIEWNETNKIRFMRMSSEMFPFASHAIYGYDLSYADKELKDAGDLAKKYGHRLTMHPGQFTQLGSPKDEVVAASVRELQYQCEIMDRMGLDQDSVMIIHMGGIHGDKEASLARFRENYTNKLSEKLKARLVLENDELCYNLDDLMPICDELNIPIVVDYHHDWIYPSKRPLSELIPIINKTWEKKGIRVKQHLSEPRPGAETAMKKRAHADRCKALPDSLPDDIDLMIEAKDKEQAVFELYRIYGLEDVIWENLRPPKADQTLATAGRKSAKSRRKITAVEEEEEGVVVIQESSLDVEEEQTETVD